MSPSRAGIAGARSVMNCGPSRALLRFVPYVRVSRSLTSAASPTRSTPDGVGSLPANAASISSRRRSSTACAQVSTIFVTARSDQPAYEAIAGVHNAPIVGKW